MWIFTYSPSAFKAVSWEVVRIDPTGTVQVPDVVPDPPERGTITGPFTPAGAWWIWAAVAMDVSPLKVTEPVMAHVLRLIVSVAVPVPAVTTGAGTS